MSIITGGLGGTHLITQGYGYITIVVPIIQGGVITPQIIHIPETYVYKVGLLSIVENQTSLDISINKISVAKYNKQSFNSNKLSIVKLAKIEQLLNELNITLPQEIKGLIHDLIIINATKLNIPTENLSFLSTEFLMEVNEDQLKLIVEKEELFVISILNLIERIERAIDVDIPDVMVLDAKRKLYYLELLDLLSKLDEEED